MAFQITIAGEAGQGIGKSAELVSKDFASRGFYTFNYRDYGSLIRGGENFNCIRISDSPVRSNVWPSDYAIILGRNSGHHLDELASGAVSIGTQEGVDFIIDPKPILAELEAPAIVANSIVLGALYKAMDQPLEGLLAIMEEYGKHASVNQEAARKGYELYDGDVKPIGIEAKGGERYLVSGSQAVAMGAVASGMDLYIAYPMTPATPILHIIANLKDKDVRAVQLENEIGVANAALGASYAGASTMIGTSGGGFALMSEAMSLQGISEVPLVAYMAMRPGPASGVPTYTGQGDLKFVLNIGHGEFPRAVIAPGDPIDAFERTAEAFYLANKFRLLSIILSDKHLAESNYTFSQKPKLNVKPERFVEEGDWDFKNYKITDDGLSPRSLPGKGLARATSYEHDENGYTTEDSGTINRMVEKRLRKTETLKAEVSRLGPVQTYGEGDKLVISWGSTKGAILDALSDLPDVKFMQVVYLAPFPGEEVRAAIDNSSSAVVVENSSTGMIADLIRESTGQKLERVIKYDGRPFGKEELVVKLQEVFK